VRLLVTGASGFVGRHLVAAAIDAGHDVRTLTRREWDGWPGVPPHNRYFGRLPFAWPANAFDGIDAVVHLAADTSSELGPAHAVNVTGTIRLAEAAQRVGASFVFLSTQSARQDAPTAYGLTKYQAEQALLALDRLNSTVVRPGLVCGAGGLFGRVAALARKLPFVPAFAEDASIQPIWIGDLVAAVLRLAADPQVTRDSPIALGLTAPERLGDLVALIASELRKPVLVLPNAPVVLAVSMMEAMRLRPPLQRENLRAMNGVVPMETRDSMRRLGVVDRSLKDIVRLSLSEPAPPDPPRELRARRVMLVGAGRIGLVHAATLSGLPGAVLRSVVDRDPRQVRMLRGIGVPVGRPSKLPDALGSTDAAVIATPPSSHLSLARSVADSGLDMLVEKPATSRPTDLDGFAKLARDRPDLRVLVGYVMLATPHVQTALRRLREGDFGRPIGFVGLTALSLIEAGAGKRWETNQELSGGGVLANSSPHVLSVIIEAFGLASQDAELARLVSSSVEDSAIVRFDYPKIVGAHYSSWCMPGYERQENRLSIRTDMGELVITTALAAFRSNDGAIEVDHQLDYDTGFNIAPDYSGSGIAAELRALTNGHGDTAASIEQAIRIERQLFAMYEHARFVERFSPSQPHESRSDDRPASAPRSDHDSDVVLDARSAALFGTSGAHLRWDNAGQTFEVDVATLPFARRHVDDALLRVTVPNFLPKARLLSERRYRAVLAAMGIRGVASAAWHTAAAMPSERALTFWAGAVALVAAELAQLPRDFRGVVLLHPYITDLAIALERYDQFERLLSLIASGQRRFGVHSNLGKLAANALSLVTIAPHVLSVLASPHSSNMIAQMRADLHEVERLRAVHLTAEVGPAPVFVHRAAATKELQIKGADSLLISALVDPRLFTSVESAVRSQWAHAFPGVDLPDVVLQ